MNIRRELIAAGVALCGLLAGCEGRPTLFPNSDPALQKTSTQFASDAAKRFPYPVQADHAGATQGRAAVDLMLDQIEILNYSNEDWKDIDIWVNQSYVCHVPLISKAKQKVETIAFAMLYDGKGNYFSTNGGKNPVNRVEIYHNGKVYDIPVKLAD